MLRQFFVNLKKGTEYLNYGRHIIERWGADHALSGKAGPECAVLDLGCGHGTDLLNIKKTADSSIKGKAHADASPRKSSLRLAGVEGYEEYVKECNAAGIETFPIDIESDKIPVEDGTYDVVVANQILEHTKEVFWIFAEVARVLKPGGIFIIGVPNLASLHNRLLLLFGQQPTAQQTLSAHVRTFTKPDLRKFAETGGFFKLKAHRGSNFYPFGKSIARPLAWMFPTLAWGGFYLLERTDRQDGSFLECLSGDDNFLETPFYGSPQNPARK